jgi:hypothetical protein
VTYELELQSSCSSCGVSGGVAARGRSVCQSLEWRLGQVIGEGALENAYISAGRQDLCWGNIANRMTSLLWKGRYIRRGPSFSSDILSGAIYYSCCMYFSYSTPTISSGLPLHARLL